MKALILMTRIPIPGKTKTRLMNVLSGEECAQLHKCFLLDLFNVLDDIKENVDVFLTYTPDGNLCVLKDMLPDYIEAFPQVGENLGERMANAIEYVLNMDYSKVVLIGSDIPTIQPNDIDKAFRLLDEHDICLGPTFDGGYYLIGMKKLYKDIFVGNLKWGKKSILENTLFIANSLGLKVGLAPKHMDIDTVDDITALKDRIDGGELKEGLPKNTVRYLNRVWGEVENVKRHLKGTN